MKCPKTVSTRHPHIAGLILAGGQGSRMGGQDKGLILYQQKPLIEQLLKAYRGQIGRLIISCNRNIDFYKQYTDEVLQDNRFKVSGPLAGLYEGLLRCQQLNKTLTNKEGVKEIKWLSIVPVDCPTLPSQHISHLMTYSGTCQASIQTSTHPANASPLVIMPKDNFGLQPLFSLISVDAIRSLEQYLDKGHRSVKRWIESIPHTICTIPESWEDYRNFNTPSDMLNN